MRRAYRSVEENSRLGIDRIPMMALVQNEEGKAIKKQPIEKLVEKLKGNIGKALDKMLKFKVDEQERANLIDAKSKLQYAKGSESLVQIISIAMDATHRHKES
ncbi:hypothetical protein [uncultured Pontibacter sp.]|uniref:hypothetical protein n=1 Tax=uncultured Pontibacter sp. TaxID=453356 RepID=UPI002621A171|nr:hypothetical protein [uncultured Pontibacter sp.]